MRWWQVGGDIAMAQGREQPCRPRSPRVPAKAGSEAQQKTDRLGSPPRPVRGRWRPAGTGTSTRSE